MKPIPVSGQLWKITVKGVVQGVGFRPFIYQLARKHSLCGWVLNTSGSVIIEVEGSPQSLAVFLKDIEENHPPQAHIIAITTETTSPIGLKGFEIRSSKALAGDYQLISPDLASCPECRSDFYDPTNRRYRYPFTNCTNCGPRFTIIENIPYDRPLTTMKSFKMCPECQKEYDNPLDRRFHAQPNACPICGPSLKLTNNKGAEIAAKDVIDSASKLLREGKIIAIRGLGGFLLTCDATSSGVVDILRQRKKRPSKPFAIMLGSLDKVREYCFVSTAEEQLLTSSAAPIVLLRSKENTAISASVAPNLKYLGVMLPYTPLHHLLLADTELPLVMTSGNLSEEPIARDNGEALARLGGIADYFILHNREIYSTYDDSVTMVVKDKSVILRRARGYAPYPIRLPFKTEQILACGAEEKNAFCFTRDDNAFLSQHIGDMENEETLKHFENTASLYEHIFRLKPCAIARDSHPDYLPSKWAESKAAEQKLPLIDVQHHHAHIASCLAENGRDEAVIGLAFDGTGYGDDGHIWGGEFLIADCKDYKRRAHLEYLPLPGGEAAVRKPYRTAIGYLYQLLGAEVLTDDLPCLRYVDAIELGLIQKQVDKGLNTPLTSSCGRLFDAVAALTGICGEINYSAQAAIELEMTAFGSEAKESYRFAIGQENGIMTIKLADLFRDILTELNNDAATADIAARFHNTITAITVEVCQRLTRDNGIKVAALSGGCFQNRRLLENTITALQKCGFEVLTHNLAPPNDGCIALGQAVIASQKLKGE